MTVAAQKKYEKRAGKYKLKAYYKKMVQKNLDGFGSYEKFAVWSYQNGYKPWKILTRLMDDDPFSPDNCTWSLDKRGGESALPISEDKSYDNIVKNLKFMAYGTMEMRLNLEKMKAIALDLRKSRKIEKDLCKDIINEIEAASTSVTDIFNSLEKLDLDARTDESEKQEREKKDKLLEMIKKAEKVAAEEKERASKKKEKENNKVKDSTETSEESAVVERENKEVEREDTSIEKEDAVAEKDNTGLWDDNLAADMEKYLSNSDTTEDDGFDIEDDDSTEEYNDTLEEESDSTEEDKDDSFDDFDLDSRIEKATGKDPNSVQSAFDDASFDDMEDF
jgi:hypothetical protein